MHWHAIGLAVQKQISSSALPSPSSEGITRAAGKYDEAVAPGEEGVVHPALLQAAATALGRVIVLIDPSEEVSTSLAAFPLGEAHILPHFHRGEANFWMRGVLVVQW